MARKARTPAPPKRPVQAPQRRDTRRPRAGAVPTTTGRNLWLIIGVLVVIAAAAISAALYFALHKSGGSHSSTTSSSGVAMRIDPAKNASYNRLPGVRKIKAPWAPEYAHLDSRLAPLGLTGAPTEQLAYHIHQHLDVFLNGKPLTVPPYIGICCPPTAIYLTQLHTHSPDGVIHVESPTKVDYTLGQFFAQWGVFLDRHCVGAYCQGYRWYVNGKRVTGNAQNLVLKAHLVIVIAIGKKQPAHIRSTYPWNGL